MAELLPSAENDRRTLLDRLLKRKVATIRAGQDYAVEQAVEQLPSLLDGQLGPRLEKVTGQELVGNDTLSSERRELLPRLLNLRLPRHHALPKSALPDRRDKVSLEVEDELVLSCFELALSLVDLVRRLYRFSEEPVFVAECQEDLLFDVLVEVVSPDRRLSGAAALGLAPLAVVDGKLLAARPPIRLPVILSV